jgi:glycosyltransferase involved in cell wall biosynthesis
VTEGVAGGAVARPASLLEQVTPLVITFNEAPNLERTLRRLSWARRIVVVDSFSTDGTLDILKTFRQAEVYQRKFDTFAGQCNFGLGKIDSEWALSIDADYVLTDDLIEEIRALPAGTGADAFSVRFKYCVWGQPLRGTLYPPRAVLYRTAKAKYVEDGHAHRVAVSGSRAELKSFIHHDDRKPLARWTSSQAKYVEAEARKFSDARAAPESLGDRLRGTKVLAPLVVFGYCLVLHRGLLDGWAGWYYAFERAFAEVLLALRLIEQENHAGRCVNERWVREQNEAASREASRLLSEPGGRLGAVDRLRRTKFLSPVLALSYTLLVQGELFRGWGGWHAAYRRTLFELLLAIHLIEKENIAGKGIQTRERVRELTTPPLEGAE